jgi:hypothetical protein
MATYVNDLRLKEITTGDESGTWGTSTNTNLELIAEAFSYGTEVITTNADTHTTTIDDGATDPGRSLYLKYTGTLDSACTITIGPNTVSKVWIIENGTSGSQNIIISQGSGANITIPAGDTKVVYSDGAGAGAAFFDAFASLSVVDLKVQDDLTVTDAALVTGVLTTTATQVATGGITSGSDIISDTDSTDSLGSTGVRWLKGWFDTLTAGTLTVGSGSVTDSSGAISFGDENLTTTGIVTAAGTSVFTNLDISGDIDVDGTTNLDVVDIDGAVDMASTALVTGVLTANGGAVFNETGADVDFRVESDTVDHALFVQGSDGFVGIGTSSPSTALHVDSLTAAKTVTIARSTTSEAVNLSEMQDYNALQILNKTSGSYLNFAGNASNSQIQAQSDASTAEDIALNPYGGNVGIGDTSPVAPLTIKGRGTFFTNVGDFGMGNNLYYDSVSDRWERLTASAGAAVYLTGGALFFVNTTAGGATGDAVTETERMRVNASGNLLVGTTSEFSGSTKLEVQYGLTVKHSNTIGQGRNIYMDDSSGTLKFYDGYNVASLSSAGAWTNASDIAYKENIVDTEHGLDVVKLLQPRDYTLKSDSSSQTGFIAQELETHLPQFVDGDEGEKGVNYGQLTAVLTKAIQEQQTLIESLTARITTLEG